MIQSDRPIVTPVTNIVFCCFVFPDLKSGDGRTDGKHVRKQWSLPAVTLGWPSGSIKLILPFRSLQWRRGLAKFPMVWPIVSLTSFWAIPNLATTASKLSGFRTVVTSVWGSIRQPQWITMLPGLLINTEIIRWFLFFTSFTIENFKRKGQQHFCTFSS